MNAKTIFWVLLSSKHANAILKTFFTLFGFDKINKSVTEQQENFCEPQTTFKTKSRLLKSNLKKIRLPEHVLCCHCKNGIGCWLARSIDAHGESGVYFKVIFGMAIEFGRKNSKIKTEANHVFKSCARNSLRALQWSWQVYRNLKDYKKKMERWIKHCVTVVAVRFTKYFAEFLLQHYSSFPAYSDSDMQVPLELS